MSKELVQVMDGLAINPATGNTLQLATEDTDVIAAERRDVVNLKKSLDDFASFLDAELNRRLDGMNTRSARVGSFAVETKAPFTTEYPVEALERVLDELIADGKLNEAVKPRVLKPQPPPPPKVDKREVLKLLAHSDQEVRQAVFEVGVETPQRRTVRVEEVGGE